MDRTIQTDVLVIGGGQAGFFAAMEAQEQGVKVTMVDKGYAGKSGQSQNITCMMYFDLAKNDLAKWMAEGPLADEYLENQDWVEAVYRESKDRWDDMAKWGMKSWRYDKDGNTYLAPINGSDDERCPGEPEEDVITNYLIHNRYHWRLRSLFQNNGGTIVDRVIVCWLEIYWKRLLLSRLGRSVQIELPTGFAVAICTICKTEIPCGRIPTRKILPRCPDCATKDLPTWQGWIISSSGGVVKTPKSLAAFWT